MALGWYVPTWRRQQRRSSCCNAAAPANHEARGSAWSGSPPGPAPEAPAPCASACAAWATWRSAPGAAATPPPRPTAAAAAPPAPAWRVPRRRCAPRATLRAGGPTHSFRSAGPRCVAGAGHGRLRACSSQVAGRRRRRGGTLGRALTFGARLQRGGVARNLDLELLALPPQPHAHCWSVPAPPAPSCGQQGVNLRPTGAARGLATLKQWLAGMSWEGKRRAPRGPPRPGWADRGGNLGWGRGARAGAPGPEKLGDAPHDSP